MDLAKFDEKSTCPKCGHGKVGVKFCGGGTLDMCRLEMRHLLEDHLDRTCERCGYVWAQSVLET